MAVLADSDWEGGPERETEFRVAEPERSDEVRVEESASEIEVESVAAVADVESESVEDGEVVWEVLDVKVFVVVNVVRVLFEWQA